MALQLHAALLHPADVVPLATVTVKEHVTHILGPVCDFCATVRPVLVDRDSSHRSWYFVINRRGALVPAAAEGPAECCCWSSSLQSVFWSFHGSVEVYIRHMRKCPDDIT